MAFSCSFSRVNSLKLPRSYRVHLRALQHCVTVVDKPILTSTFFFLPAQWLRKLSHLQYQNSEVGNCNKAGSSFVPFLQQVERATAAVIKTSGKIFVLGS